MEVNMQAKILNLFSNIATNNKNLKGGHGQSFLITIDGKNILYDTGLDGHTLLNNMETLSISPNDITKLVLSHGHTDHTGGLPDLLDERNEKNVLPLIAHPSFREKKIYKVLYLFNKFLACPPLTSSQENN